QVTMSGGAPRQFQWSRQLRAIGGPVHESSHVCGQQLCDDHAHWNIAAGYSYLQDDLRADMRLPMIPPWACSSIAPTLQAAEPEFFSAHELPLQEPNWV